jgi:hypothetical protein
LIGRLAAKWKRRGSTNRRRAETSRKFNGFRPVQSPILSRDEQVAAVGLEPDDVSISGDNELGKVPVQSAAHSGAVGDDWMVELVASLTDAERVRLMKLLRAPRPRPQASK